MRRQRLILAILLGVSTLLLSACYTVVLAPSTTQKNNDESAWDMEGVENNKTATNRWEDDYYRYPNAPGYSYSSSVYPSDNGYDSRYGNYGYGGYGHGYPYYYDYRSAYGYGYDPYYSGGGTYTPPGYRLVSDRELEQMQQTIIHLSNPAPQSSSAIQDAQLTKQKEEQEAVWQRRNEPRFRSAPEVAPRSITPAAPPPSSSGKTVRSAPARSTSTGSSKSSGSSGKSSSSSSEKSSSRPKKRGR
jgi:hypothetical protein